MISVTISQDRNKERMLAKDRLGSLSPPPLTWCFSIFYHHCPLFHSIIIQCSILTSPPTILFYHHRPLFHTIIAHCSIIKPHYFIPSSNLTISYHHHHQMFHSIITTQCFIPSPPNVPFYHHHPMFHSITTPPNVPFHHHPMFHSIITTPPLLHSIITSHLSLPSTLMSSTVPCRQQWINDFSN